MQGRKARSSRINWIQSKILGCKESSRLEIYFFTILTHLKSKFLDFVMTWPLCIWIELFWTSSNSWTSWTFWASWTTWTGSRRDKRPLRSGAEVVVQRHENPEKCGAQNGRNVTKTSKVKSFCVKLTHLSAPWHGRLCARARKTAVPTKCIV